MDLSLHLEEAHRSRTGNEALKPESFAAACRVVRGQSGFSQPDTLKSNRHPGQAEGPEDPLAPTARGPVEVLRSCRMNILALRALKKPKHK